MTAETQNNQSRTTHLLDKTQLSKGLQDIKDWVQKKDWSEFSLNATIIIFLITLGILVRLLLAYNYRLEYASLSSDIIWNRHVNFDPNNANLEGYSDFPYFYYNWIRA